ncbi:MAG: RHS repeat-associated core domain-containing protein [Gallionella sp.]
MRFAYLGKERAKETEANGTVSYNFNPRLDSGLHADYRVKANGDKAYVNYLYAGNRPVGTYTINWAAASNTTSYDLKYFHLDGQGSIIAITNSVGAVVERLSYDAWGKRRNANGTDDLSNALVSSSTDHGYTGHEHLDDMGLIHMNGRVYDPRTGRFLQADPTIQSPGNLQSFNRYSYVMNNPFFYTDPSGFSAFTKLRGIAKIAIGAVLTIASSAGCTACGYAAIPFFQSGVNDLNGDPSTKNLSIPPIQFKIPIDNSPTGNGNIGGNPSSGGNSGSNNSGNSNDVNRSGYSSEDMSRYSRELSQKISGTLLISGDADVPEFYNEGCNCTRYPIDDMGSPLEKVYFIESVFGPIRGVSATLSVVGRSDILVLGRGPLTRLEALAIKEGGRVSTIDSNIPQVIFKQNYRDIRSADKIVQYMDNIPQTYQESIRIGGQYSRAEVFMINQRPDLLLKTRRKFEV